MAADRHGKQRLLPAVFSTGGDRFTVLNRGLTLGTSQRGMITPEELQDLMAGGQELATLEGSLGGTV